MDEANERRNKLITWTGWIVAILMVIPLVLVSAFAIPTPQEQTEPWARYVSKIADVEERVSVLEWNESNPAAKVEIEGRPAPPPTCLLYTSPSPRDS